MVPEPIREFIDEVKQHLDVLTRYEGPDLALDEKINFLRETRHAFGRTALVLSGGGALGAFHVVRAPGPGGALRSEWSRAARFFAECTSHALAGCSRRSCAACPPCAEPVDAAAGRGEGAVRAEPAAARAGGQQRGLHRCRPRS